MMVKRSGALRGIPTTELGTLEDINGSKEFIEKTLKLIREDKELGFIIVDKVNRRIEPRKGNINKKFRLGKGNEKKSPDI